MSALGDEWRITRRDRAFRWTCLVLLALTAFALWNGARFEDRRNADAAAAVERSIDKRVADREALLAERAGATPVNPWGASEPTKADWNAVRPAGPLASLSFGREDVEPLSASISLWMTRPDNLFRKYEFESEQTLAAGRFDAGFLVILLLPLFALALTYNVVADERDSGRLRLALATGPGVPGRLLTRMALRLSPIFACVLVIVAVAGVRGAPADRLALWAASAFLYLAIWAGLALLIASLRKRAEAIALAAAALWLGVVVLLPAAGSTMANALSSTPSAFALINNARAAEVRANRRLMENLDGYVSDHPELASAELNEDDWSAKLYASQRVVERDVAPIIADQETARAHQIAWSERFRFFSPAAVADQLLTTAAGTGAGRQRAYVDQAQSFLLTWRKALAPMIFRRERLGPEHIATLPTFSFVEPSLPKQTVGTSVAYLLMMAAAALVLGAGRLRRIEGS